LAMFLTVSLSSDMAASKPFLNDLESGAEGNTRPATAQAGKGLTNLWNRSNYPPSSDGV